MKYKVTTTWIVEVTEAETQHSEKGYGQPVDPKKLAVFKAVQRSVESLRVRASGTTKRRSTLK